MLLALLLTALKQLLPLRPAGSIATLCVERWCAVLVVGAWRAILSAGLWSKGTWKWNATKLALLLCLLYVWWHKV